jgi:hypothetical protein
MQQLRKPGRIITIVTAIITIIALITPGARMPGAGWFMRGQVGSDPGRSFNLARSWARYGSNAGGPSVGVIVVWRHHVGKIVGHENGQWIIQSGNDGRAVRTRPRSIAGAIAFRRA